MAIEDLGILGQPIFTNVILPFMLVFVIVFAILEKTEILGKGKRQINAIISFVFALIFVAVPAAVSTTLNIIPIVAVILVIVLSFMLMFGFIGGTKEGGLPNGLKITFGILFGVAMVAAILWATGALDKIKIPESAVPLIIFVAFVIAIFSVVLTSKPAESQSHSPLGRSQ